MDAQAGLDPGWSQTHVGFVMAWFKSCWSIAYSKNPGSIPGQCRSLSLLFIMKSFLQSFTPYICSYMYRSNQFLVKMKATYSGKMLDSQPRNETMAELCSGEFNVAYCCDPE
jgi:hypothetical protein